MSNVKIEEGYLRKKGIYAAEETFPRGLSLWARSGRAYGGMKGKGGSTRNCDNSSGLIPLLGFAKSDKSNE